MTVMDKINVLGYSISARGLQKDVSDALNWVERRTTPCYMACANPHSLVTASSDPLFRDSLQHADLLLPDGIGVVLAAKAFNTPVVEKVAGYDFFIRFSEMAQRRGGVRYFFLGSSPQVLALMRQRLSREFPAIELCGSYSPPYKELFSETDNGEMVAAVNAASPDVLWVGMTAPKQEKWIYQHRDRLRVPFIGAIGAVFDFYAGTKPRSSALWIELGLEWLSRFLKEPRRLWARNFRSAPVFVWWVMKEKMRQLLSVTTRR